MGLAPVVFAFHGHSGTAAQAAFSFDLQQAWPGAICVYGQGLPTKTEYIDPQGKYNGWDITPSETNKDIRFFDALYSTVMKQYGGDPRRVYAMGHSNGGYFMYTLWQMRTNQIAAFGAFEAAKGQCNPTVPKPLFVSIGSQDRIVPPFIQKRSLSALMKLDGSAPQGTSFGSNGTLFPGLQPIALWAYNGTHKFPQDAVPSLVDFFSKLSL